MAQCQGPRSDGETFFLIFTYIWQEDLAKITKVGPVKCKSGLAITSVIHLHLASFCAQNTFKKIRLEKC